MSKAISLRHDYLDVESVNIMKISALTLNEPKRKSLVPSALLGAAIGSAARYVVPTKDEFSALLNKPNIDSFVSSAAMKTRGADRSILAYSAIGAVILAGVTALVNHFKGNKETNQTPQYTKLGALIDASPYACEVVWYED